MKWLFNRREVRFLIIGGINTVFGFAMFALFSLAFGQILGPVYTLIIAAIPTTAVAYISQRLIVWQSGNEMYLEVMRFALTAVFQILCNAILLALLADWLGLNSLIAQAIITIFLVIALYFIHRYWTFKVKKSPSGQKTGKPLN